MKIVETNLKFRNLSNLGPVKQIVLHHSVSGNVGAATIHNWHLSNGWSGIGYHFVVKMDGTIERGRPENKLGTHVSSKNTGRLGICFVGDFTKNKMDPKQIKAGIELVSYLKGKYNVGVVKHSDLMATSCPGKLFPFKEIVSKEIPSKPLMPPVQDDKLESISISGNEVIALQKELNKQGFAKLKVDGYFGDKTLNACPLLKFRNKGNITKLMQQRLKNRGYNIGNAGVDGDFGTSTLAAIKKLQACFNLKQDGIVGTNTWKALYGLNKGNF